MVKFSEKKSANFRNAGGYPAMDWHSRGSRNTPSRSMPQKREISADLMDHLARMQTYRPKKIGTQWVLVSAGIGIVLKIAFA